MLAHIDVNGREKKKRENEDGTMPNMKSEERR